MLNNKNLVFILIFSVFCFIFSFTLNYSLLRDKITDYVVQKLKKDYTPGPYNPKLDLDKGQKVVPNTSWNAQWEKGR